jgi:hypothetical protein
MKSCSSLKRSMPCIDLISMSSSSKDTLRPFASKRLRRSSGKRQHLSSLSFFEDITSLSSAEENPATAALEKTLASFQEETHMYFEELLECDIAVTKQLTCAVDFLFADFMPHHHRRTPCKTQRKPLLALSHVPDMSDITHVLSRMATSL